VLALGGALFTFHLERALRELETANEEKTEQLWQSYLERARALRSSGRIGQRFEALKVIREAARIKRTTELRDEAGAALLLPDLEVALEWTSPTEDALCLAHDPAFGRLARINRRGEITVFRVSAGGEEVLARLPVHGRPPFWGLWMSPDG